MSQPSPDPGHSAGSSPIVRDRGEVRVVTGLDEFAGLGPGWDSLVARSGMSTPFVSHAWFDAAWRWRQATATLKLLCWFCDNALVAALPLVVAARQAFGATIRELTFLTVPDTQHCDVVVAAGDRAAAAAAFAGALSARRSEWDVMRLEYLASNSRAGTDLRAALEARGYHARIRPSADNPFVSLDTTWDAYYATRSRRLKKANNLAANRLQKMGAVKIDWLAPGTGSAEDAARATRIASEISAHSWKSATGNSLDNPGPGAFIRRLSEVAHPRGWLSVWILSVGGAPVAMEYHLVDGGCVYALRSDFDAAVEEQASPGSYLSRQLIERLFGTGLRRYFMGPGHNPYKYRWSEGADPRFTMTVYGRTLRGRALRAWECALKPAARAVRDRLRRGTHSAPTVESDHVDPTVERGHRP